MESIKHLRALTWLTSLLTVVSACQGQFPSATAEGTLRMKGQPLDNCLVTFLPEAGEKTSGFHSTGLTDAQSHYCLRFDDQRQGATIGWHRVTVEDLSVSTGVRRRDHGTVDE